MIAVAAPLFPGPGNLLCLSLLKLLTLAERRDAKVRQPGGRRGTLSYLSVRTVIHDFVHRGVEVSYHEVVMAAAQPWRIDE